VRKDGAPTPALLSYAAIKELTRRPIHILGRTARKVGQVVVFRVCVFLAGFDGI
jgi:hypothetical protein